MMSVLAFPLDDTWGMHDGVGTGWGIVMLIGMVLFWGFVWPWLLIALHKPVLRRLVARLVKEVDTPAPAGGPSIADTSRDRRQNLTGR